MINLLGKTIGGRYKIESVLGHGGMSTVYRATHEMIGRELAIKVLRPDALPVNGRERLLREARAVNRINHENIVRIEDLGEAQDGTVFLVMELVVGTTLYEVIETSGPQPVERVLRIGSQIASALEAAHGAGIVHRDLKPENIILTPKGENEEHVKILDFGVAKLLDAPSLTLTGRLLGTPGYIAPEVITSGKVEPRTDLYSFGVLLYEALSGASPYTATDSEQLVVQSVTDDPIPPSARVKDIDPELEALILKCLEKQPEDRFDSATTLLRALETITVRLVGELGVPRP